VRKNVQTKAISAIDICEKGVFSAIKLDMTKLKMVWGKRNLEMNEEKGHYLIGKRTIA
jgi:hypothetical protein